MSRTVTGTILDTILAHTIEDIAARRQLVPLQELEQRARARSMTVSLRQRLAEPGLSVIAEFKRASPSKGRFPVEVDPAVVAVDYIEGGASAISVLTDTPFFQGSLDDLRCVAEIAHGATPTAAVLRKDFVVDPYQIVEARAHGADAVLLIVAALEDAELSALLTVAMEWDLDALVEVHDDRELARAVAARAQIIGINNRDLRTFHVDLATSERLAPMVPDSVLVVAESGVCGREEVARLAAAGADAVLVGEHLMLADDRPAAVRALRSGQI
jgi:indole-3-glycerol phosphate synthase